MDRVHIVIVADGIDKLDEEYQVNLEATGIFNIEQTCDFRQANVEDGNDGITIKYKKLSYINHDNMNDEVRDYGTYNLGHCFSKYMEFSDWLLGLSEFSQSSMKIDNYDIHDFLLGSNRSGKVKHAMFKHLKMPTHLVVKHRNQGKIESHKWFFKGF